MKTEKSSVMFVVLSALIMMLSACQSTQSAVVRRDEAVKQNQADRPKEADLIVYKSYPVTVDCGQSLDEMVVAGRYDLMNESEVSPASFRLKCGGKVEVNLSLISLGLTNDSDARLSLDKLGCLPASNEHMLVFGAKFPNKQLESTIVALGSNLVDSLGRRYVNFLDSRYDHLLGIWDLYAVWRGPKRILHLFSMTTPNSQWPENSLFLAVCKQSN